MKINPYKQFVTVGVKGKFEESNHMGDLLIAVVKEFRKQPNVCINGGDDKEFFAFEFFGTKLFVAVNEVNGLTVMLPEEY